MDNSQTDTEHGMSESPKIDLLDYLLLLFKARKFILSCVGIVLVVSLIVSFLLPVWYKATSSILPPKEEGFMNQLGAASSLLKGIAPMQRFANLGGNTGAYNYLAILKSRSALEDVARKFNLMSEYGISDSSMEKTLEELKDNVTFKIEDEDYISIEVYDKSPLLAAEMANYFTDVLNRISNQLGTQEARNNREFIEARLDKCKEDLRASEEMVKKYQEKSGTMMIPEQSASSISSIAELYGLKTKKEVELAILERNASPDNASLQQLRLELDELNKKLLTFPEMGMESFRLYRDVAVQQKIVEMLVPMYEQAKIDEKKDTPVILVLDKAQPPERKSKPKRLIIIAASTFSGFLVSCFLVFMNAGFRRREEDPAFAARLRNMRTESKFFRRLFHPSGHGL